MARISSFSNAITARTGLTIDIPVIDTRGWSAEKNKQQKRG